MISYLSTASLVSDLPLADWPRSSPLHNIPVFASFSQIHKAALVTTQSLLPMHSTIPISPPQSPLCSSHSPSPRPPQPRLHSSRSPSQPLASDPSIIFPNTLSPRIYPIPSHLPLTSPLTNPCLRSQNLIPVATFLSLSTASHCSALLISPSHKSRIPIPSGAHHHTRASQLTLLEWT